MKSLAWEGDHPITQQFAETRFFDYSIYRDSLGKPLKGHNGIDLGMPQGTRLLAPEAGTWWTGLDLDEQGNLVGYGIYGTLTGSDSGRIWLFGHCRMALAASGEQVAQGAVLAFSGTTGNSSGPHLHLGLRPLGYDRANGFAGYVDPYPLLVELTTQQEDDVSDEERQALLKRIAELEEDQARINLLKGEMEWLLRELEAKRRLRRGTTDRLIATVLDV